MPISFKNDYSEGAHPKIIQALSKINMEQNDGYGEDSYTFHTKSLIQDIFHCPNSTIHFMVGGTQTNLTLIAHVLRPHQAVISAHTGHICVHETGAIEATGHKVISVPSNNGKLTPQQIDETIKIHIDCHMVQPKMVYISNPTEIGTIYTKEELIALYKACRKYGLYLYLDGARLASALQSKENNLKPEDFASLTDAFYIGGTKCGALFGEALVINHPVIQEDFRFIIKQRGALLAKGWLIAIQFQTLFEDHLYFDLGQHANQLASQLQQGIALLGYPFFCESSTNQIFPIFGHSLIQKLEEKYQFETWERRDKTDVIRLVTSWATSNENIKAFLNDLSAFGNSFQYQ